MPRTARHPTADPPPARTSAPRPPVPAPSFALERTFTHRLHTLSKLTDRVSQAAYAAEAGLAFGEGRCLAAIGAFCPMSVVHLAQRANLDKGQASRAAQALVAQGLVRKQASRTDARGVVLSLTPRGAQVWQRVRALIARRNAEILACLQPDEVAVLDTLLDRLVAHAGAAASIIAPPLEPPCPSSDSKPATC